MAKIDVILVNAQDGQSWPAEVVIDQPVGWWINQILDALGLPQEENGQQLHYQFVLERTGQVISEKQELQSVGVQAGDVLHLERAEARAAVVGPVARAGFPGWIWILGGIVVFALSGFLLIIGGRFIREQSTRHSATQTSQAWNTEQTSIAQAAATEGSLATATMQIFANKQGAFTATTQAQVNTPTESPANWPIVLFDTFQDNQNGWTLTPYESEVVDHSRKIENGVYRWEATAGTAFVSNRHLDIKVGSHFYLAVLARQVEGPGDGSYGLLFRRPDQNNCYIFRINNRQEYAFHAKIDKKYSAILDWEYSSAIRPGKNNKIAVVAEGSQFTFFVNDQLVAQAQDVHLDEGNAGVVIGLQSAGDTATFEFDNFELHTK